MARSIKGPLLAGGGFALVYPFVALPTAMSLGGYTPEPLSPFLMSITDIAALILLAYLPAYFIAMVASISLKKMKKDLWAFRVSVVPLMAVAVFSLICLVRIVAH